MNWTLVEIKGLKKRLESIAVQCQTLSDDQDDPIVKSYLMGHGDAYREAAYEVHKLIAAVETPTQRGIEK